MRRIGGIPNRFTEQENAQQESHEGPPLCGRVASFQEQSGKGGRGQNFALCKDCKHAGADIAQGDKGENIHGAVNECQYEHFVAVANNVSQVLFEGNGCCG